MLRDMMLRRSGSIEHRIIAIVASPHHGIELSRQRTIALLRQLSSHTHAVNVLLPKCSTDANLDGAIVNYMVLSWFDRSGTFTKCLNNLSWSGSEFSIKGEHITSDLVSHSCTWILIDTYDLIYPFREVFGLSIAFPPRYWFQRNRRLIFRIGTEKYGLIINQLFLEK